MRFALGLLRGVECFAARAALRQANELTLPTLLPLPPKKKGRLTAAPLIACGERLALHEDFADRLSALSAGKHVLTFGKVAYLNGHR